MSIVKSAFVALMRATVRTTEKGMERELVGVAFGGSRQELIIGQQSMMSGGNN